jgi:hypothetical protein
MIRDTRPVLEQVKSGLKIAGILLVLCASVLVVLSLLPLYRMEAWAWHWKHGNNVQAGDVTVPVPNEWLVRRSETGMTHEIELINTEGGKSFWGTINISVEQPPRNVTLADFASFQRRSMGNLGIQVTTTRQLEIAGLTGLCLDGETMMIGRTLRNISCRLGSNLSIQYVGSSLKAPSFYSILDGIAKASTE